ncbi:hypothetical protein DRP07_03555 [Archaeoglobales archaeon]|nr:MAG: hypothetical protein DRP07_03555 [Archaeoglobales archaeon]
MGAEPSLTLVNLHVQILGVVFLIQTFVILFYYNVNQNKEGRAVKDFRDWISKWVLVWFGLSIPILVLVSFSPVPYLAGLESGFTQASSKEYFFKFWRTEMPYILVPYYVSVFLYALEFGFLKWHIKYFEKPEINTYRCSLSLGLIFLLIFIGIIFFAKLSDFETLLALLGLFIVPIACWVGIPYLKLFRKTERK